MDLAVLLSHVNGESGVDVITRYALKADSLTIAIAKTPIQIPIPQNSPALVDFGIFRPSITLSCIIDTEPANTLTTTESFGPSGNITLVHYEGMEAITHKGLQWYIPYKNKLEDAVYNWVADGNNVLTLTVGDDTYPVFDHDSTGAEQTSGAGNNAHATGGSSYVVALQQVRFQLDAGREDRWIVQMQFVCESRLDTKVRLFS
jgi:hypothetical protein|tara:strand:+ start:1256 stop:1864 length:609 start_codon:yes stop_codon:yes gene_type:complete